MAPPAGECDTLLKELRHLVSLQSYPDNFRNSMMIASEWVEQAALCMSEHQSGHRVAELLLLAARLEDLSLSHAPNAFNNQI